MEKNKMTRVELIGAARMEEWDIVDKNLEGYNFSDEDMSWAIGIGLFDKDQNIRDLAATILDKSDIEISPEEAKALQRIMVGDPYHIVKYRLAIALFKRNYKTVAVKHMMDKAKDDPDVGGLVRSYSE